MSDESATEPTEPEAEATEAPNTPTEEVTPEASENIVAPVAPDTQADTAEAETAEAETAEATTTEASTADPADSVETVATPETTPETTAEETPEATSEATSEETPSEPSNEEPGVVAPETVSPETVAAAAGDQPEASEPDSPDAPPHVRVGERPAITAPRDIGEVADDLSAEDFAAVIERTVFEFKEGDIVGGTVVRVDPDEVLVDIGFKAEGVIPIHELSIRNQINPGEVVKEGEPIEALVLQMEDDQGRLVLSKKRAQYERAWGRIEQIMNEGGTVTGPVIEVVKGGLIVDIGLRGFLPASLVDLRRVRDLAPFIGEAIEAKVIELDKNRNNVVLSRRAHLEEAQAEQRQAFLSGLEEGDIRDGVVSSVVNFGAFVDLGGMDGLVHVSELSWQHVSHPSEVVSVGDKVKVRVLTVERDRERISLSIRQTREDPWEEFIRDTDLGTILDGEVTKTVPFGAFIAVGEGVEGLVHVSEIALHHVESPELELSIGQQVRVKVTEIDADRRRVSLSIKQALPEWEERSTFSQRRQPTRPRRREFQREDEATEVPTFAADASLEAILEELKERGIGRK